MDPLGAQVRLVYFFDTPDLALEGHAVVVRARPVAQKGDESVVKLRPVAPSDRRATCASRGYACSALMKGLSGRR